MHEMFRVGDAEILDVLARACDKEEGQAIFMRIRGRAKPEKIAELQATLKAWIDSIPDSDHAAFDGARECGGLVAFYRID